MEKRARQKAMDNKGFSMGEMLVAILILLLASVIMANGIPAAKNAYERVVIASNAEILLSTTVNTLRNELGTAQNVVTGNEQPEDRNETVSAYEGTMITYFNTRRESTSRIYVQNAAGDKDKVIMLKRYFFTDKLKEGSEAPNSEELISSVTATGDLYVTYGSVNFDKEKGIITFENLSVNRKSGSVDLATRDKLSIRVLSEAA